MKPKGKKIRGSDAVKPTVCADDGYVAGQLCGAVFQRKSDGGDGASKKSGLAALFSQGPAAAPRRPLFVSPEAVRAQRKADAEEAAAKKEKENSNKVEVMKALWSKAQEEKSKEKEGRNRLKHKPSDDNNASKLFARENALDNADKAEQHKEETSKSKREEKKRKHTEDVGDKEPKPAENKSGWSERPPKKAKSDAVTAEDKEKRKRTVFVGNLPMSLAKEAVKKFFRPCGVIESVRLRCIARADPDMSLRQAAIQGKTHPQRNNKNAYVVFKEEQGAVQALSRNGEEIQSGFHIRVDAASGEKSHDHKRSVFIGNLPYDVEEDRIRSHFEPCGPVESVRVVRDRESGMGKGFGYILFKSTDAVLLALHLDGSEMAGRKVRVKRSVKKEKIKPGRAGRPANSSRPGKSGRPGNAGKAGNAGRPGNSRTLGNSGRPGNAVRPGNAGQRGRGDLTPPAAKGAAWQPKGSRNFMGEMAEKPVKKPKVRSKPGQSKVNKKGKLGRPAKK